MKPFPHRYAASARARAIGRVVISAPAVSPIDTAPRPEFDGPGGTWSPEMLLCAAVADCFVLTFRGVARAAHFNWTALECRVEGVLEHVGNATHFTRFAMTARLTLPPGADEARARLLLSKADHGCLIANSLRGERTFSVEVVSIKTEGESSARAAAIGTETHGRRPSSRERQAEAQPLR
jgi:organic hydroperoxide reductase OsmC/OhrA